MPYSDTTFDYYIKQFIKKQVFYKVVDIGAGAGKYGVIVKKINPKSKIIAIEAESSYIKEFKLEDIYDEVHVAKAEVFFNDKPDFTTDIAIIGDCIEHLKKSDGIDLLHYLIYRSKFIICVFPSKYIQYSWNNHPHESHLSVWSELDFNQFEYKYKKKEFMNMVIIKGYIGDSNSQYPKG